MQVWPAIDVRGGKCVRLRQGDSKQETVFDEDPVSVAAQWVNQGAECLHLVHHVEPGQCRSSVDDVENY